MIVDRRLRGAYSSLMMEAVRTSETSVDNHFTRQYNPEDSSEHSTAVVKLRSWSLLEYTAKNNVIYL